MLYTLKGPYSVTDTSSVQVRSGTVRVSAFDIRDQQATAVPVALVIARAALPEAGRDMLVMGDATIRWEPDVARGGQGQTSISSGQHMGYIPKWCRVWATHPSSEADR